MGNSLGSYRAIEFVFQLQKIGIDLQVFTVATMPNLFIFSIGLMHGFVQTIYLGLQLVIANEQ